MIVKNIKYTDYNGVEREEPFLFNLSKAELMEMEMGTKGGLTEMIQKIIATKDQPSIIAIFKKLVLQAYGEKSADGRRFIKTDENGRPLSIAFSETEAYSKLFMELATDDVKAAEFVNGIIPADLKVEDATNLINLPTDNKQE
ncbi:MAG: hypothetical protein PUE66_01305 [Erysipelotrichaceae bacterium]|nr:hypothetical protein [Erysipelotrichaceae bacterium]